MKNRIIIGIVLLVFAGCTSKESFLEEKSACYKYKTQLEAEVEKVDANGLILLNKLFYSPKEDSCLYTEAVHWHYGNYFVDFYLKDVFTREQLLQVTGCDGDCMSTDLSTAEAEKEFKQKIMEYE